MWEKELDVLVKRGGLEADLGLSGLQGRNLLVHRLLESFPGVS